MSEYNFLSCLLCHYKLNTLVDLILYKYFADMKLNKFSNLIL